MGLDLISFLACRFTEYFYELCKQALTLNFYFKTWKKWE